MREAAKNGTNHRLNATAAHLQDLNHQSRMQRVHIGVYVNVGWDTLVNWYIGALVHWYTHRYIGLYWWI